MKALNPDKEKMYKFLGVEQADGIRTKQVYERVKEEMKKRLKLLMKSELNDENLIQAINSKVIPVAAYPMNVCKITKDELNELDQIVKRELRKSNMLGKQASDEQLYLKRDQGGGGLKSIRDIVCRDKNKSCLLDVQVK